jgi:hypothetical protein
MCAGPRARATDTSQRPKRGLSEVDHAEERRWELAWKLDSMTSGDEVWENNEEERES